MSAKVYAEDLLETTELSRRALSMPMPLLDSEQKLGQFAAGRSLFNQMWVIAPSSDEDIDGLGPLYNSISCLACHSGNGRGHAPDGPTEKMRSMLVRLSIPGENPFHSEPHLVYGGQLQEFAVPGVPAEGRAEIHYEYSTIALSEGETVTLRKPSIKLVNPGYGEFGEVLTSARIGPALVGMGLVEMIDKQEILSWQDADDANADGISGRVNWIIDDATLTRKIGRFGYKASIVSLNEQIASAFQADLGLTSALFPEENCSDVQLACQQAVSGGKPELTAEQLQAVSFYLQFLAVPAPRDQSKPEVIRGRAVFDEAGCTACHRPQIKTSSTAKPAAFANRLIAPYSDYLLHDMGEELSDHRPDSGATGAEWRTAPLWGIGLAEKVGDRVGYLHDGRATTLLEAILWHGGEGQKSRDGVINMPKADRDALLQFLKSL
ncbi:di-heme oxidoredictase family protein [Methylophaga muralis]|uniref:di-heme oxidoreductase family protein n=1 Tax=Methylophaga muralis TaxID=291169 RepID=UPI001C402959|nr:di-heme oxidoredictase family protein [Methylophaga muralis]